MRQGFRHTNGVLWFTVVLLTAASAITARGDTNNAGVGKKVVYLVPDLPTFLYYLSRWNGEERFPIFMNRGRYFDKFVRAYKPDSILKARAVRVGAVNYNLLRGTVYAAWGKETLKDLPQGVSRSSLVGRLSKSGGKPEGIVLTDPEAKQLPAALSLAAAHHQVLDFLTLPSAVQKMDLSAAMSLEQKEDVRKRVIKIIERWGYSYDKLGDDMDYITLALDLPMAYMGFDHATGAKQRLCLDDGINRVTPDGSIASAKDNEEKEKKDRGDCYAYVGRLLEAEEGMSLYQAMCSIFLGTSNALYFDRWPEKWGLRCQEGWWVMQTRIHSVLVKQKESSMARWRELVGELNPYDFVHVSSAGGPTQWGDGKVSDIPESVPAIVYFAHSFSAADPYDAATIAGRWLRNGAYIYFGAIAEPFGQSFNAARTVAVSAVAGDPLGKAFQAKAMLPARFTFPWKQIYIGDPLYRMVFLDDSEESKMSRTFRQAAGMIRERNLGPAIETLEDLLESADEPADRQRAWELLNRTFRLKFYAMRTGRIPLPDRVDSSFVDCWYNDTYDPNGNPTTGALLNKRLSLFETELARLYEGLYRTIENRPRLKDFLSEEIARLRDGATYGKIWLSAGPFKEADDASSENPFRPGDILRLGATWEASTGTTRWQLAMVNPDDNYLDLSALYEVRNSIIYAATFPVLKKDDATPVRLNVSATDRVEVWLNNKTVGSVSATGGEKNKQESIDLVLQPGENFLFLKVFRAGDRCGLYARLTDRNGNYLEDLSYADAVAKLSAGGGKVDPNRWRPAQ